MGNNKIISRLDIRFKPNIIFYAIWIILIGIVPMFTIRTEESKVINGTSYYRVGVGFISKNSCVEDEVVPFIITGIIPFIILGIIIPLLVLLKNYIVAKRCYLVLEESQIIGIRRRLFSSNQIQIPIEKLDNVSILRDIFDKLFYGGCTVSIHSNTGTVRFPYVHNATEFSSACVAQIEKFKGMVRNNPVPMPVQPIPQNNGSVSDKLAELQRMKNQGLITEEQFEAKRQELLSKF